jgi:hypothetical protein
MTRLIAYDGTAAVLWPRAAALKVREYLGLAEARYLEGEGLDYEQRTERDDRSRRDHGTRDRNR